SKDAKSARTTIGSSFIMVIGSLFPVTLLDQSSYDFASAVHHPLKGAGGAFHQPLAAFGRQLARPRRPRFVPAAHEGLGRRDVADVLVRQLDEPRELVGRRLLDPQAVLHEVLGAVGRDPERSDPQALDFARELG